MSLTVPQVTVMKQRSVTLFITILLPTKVIGSFMDVHNQRKKKTDINLVIKKLYLKMV